MENGVFQALFDAFMEYKGVGFVSLQYRNKDGELSKRLLNVGARYDNAKKKDIETIDGGVDYIPSDKYTRTDWDMALTEVKQSLVNPDKARSDGQKNAYIVLNESNGSVRFNVNQQEVYLFAKSEKKEVLEAGVYKTVNSKPKTLAKKAISKTYLKSEKFRSFIIKNLAGVVKVNKQVINIDGEDREENVIEIVME